MKNLIRIFSATGGFTIVELTITILIMSILIGIAVATYNTSLESSQRATCRANLRILAGAISNYHLNKDKWPDPDNAMGELVGNYLKTEPKCPKALKDPSVGDSYIYDENDHSFRCPGEKARAEGQNVDVEYSNHKL